VYLGVPLKDIQLARIGTTQHARADLAVALLTEAEKTFSAIASHETGLLTDLPFPLNAVLVTLKVGGLWGRAFAADTRSVWH
jgi:hypothetical protein